MSDETNDLTQDELTTLKARADLMGVTYHPSIGLEKLRAKVAEAIATGSKGEEPETPKQAAPVAAPVAETENQRNNRLQMEAMELIRIRLSCMNPAKKEWEGEIITVGNSVVGMVKKYIPFNAEEGWHVPRIMLEALKERQCQVFVTLRTKNGVAIRKGKLIKEFAIEVLPPLTQEELHDLAQRQAMAKSVD
jgi:hypothetical protein